MRYEKQADPFYATPAWRKVRRQAFMRDGGMCVQCMAEFTQCDRVRPRRATVVHHIKPRTQCPELALDLQNLQCLCDEHHAKMHPEKGERGGAVNAQVQTPAGMKIIKI